MADFGKTASDYATHRQGFPPAFFDALAARGVGLAGQRVLDIGTGTGALARGFAARGVTTIGADISFRLLDEARRLAREAGLAIAFYERPAEATGFDDASFDAVTAGQCWHWFDRDRAGVEFKRVLKPGGKLVLAYFDAIPEPGNLIEATNQLIERYNPSWPYGCGLGRYPQWQSDLEAHGFSGIEEFSLEVDVPYSHEGWLGRLRACAGVIPLLGGAAGEKFLGELAAMMKQRFAEQPMNLRHRAWGLVGTSPPDPLSTSGGEGERAIDGRSGRTLSASSGEGGGG